MLVWSISVGLSFVGMKVFRNEGAKGTLRPHGPRPAAVDACWWCLPNMRFHESPARTLARFQRCAATDAPGKSLRRDAVGAASSNKERTTVPRLGCLGASLLGTGTQCHPAVTGLARRKLEYYPFSEAVGDQPLHFFRSGRRRRALNR